MKDMNAPDFLWAEAFATAVYAINRTVSSSLGKMTPFEAFFDRKPDISHMRVWYSDAYAHQPKDLGAKKLGERGWPVKFLGYPEESAGYKLYEPSTHKVFVARKPLFREEASAPRTTLFKTEGSDLDDNTPAEPVPLNAMPDTATSSAPTPDSSSIPPHTPESIAPPHLNRPMRERCPPQCFDPSHFRIHGR